MSKNILKVGTYQDSHTAIMLSHTPTLFGTSPCHGMLRCHTLPPTGILSQLISWRTDNVLPGEGTFQRHDQDSFKLGNSSY